MSRLQWLSILLVTIAALSAIVFFPKPWTPYIIGACVVAGLVILILWVVPQRQVTAIRGLEKKELFTLENEARRTLAQILAGVFVLFGLYFTARNSEIARDSVERTAQIGRENLKLAQDKESYERFNRAVIQLNDEKIEVKLLAVYTLEQIAQSQGPQRSACIDLLSAYVRDKAGISNDNLHSASTRGVPIEIQTILSVLGRAQITAKRSDASESREGWVVSKVEQENRVVLSIQEGRTTYSFTDEQRIDLRSTDLRGANLSHAGLSTALLSDSNLSGAFLTSAIVIMADLRMVNFENADLSGTTFLKSNLDKARLGNANLTDTSLRGCSLIEADLRGVDLSHTEGLTWEQLDKAFIDGATKIPDKLRRKGLRSVTHIKTSVAS